MNFIGSKSSLISVIKNVLLSIFLKYEKINKIQIKRLPIIKSKTQKFKHLKKLISSEIINYKNGKINLINQILKPNSHYM
jgi:hypothetical protein